MLPNQSLKIGNTNIFYWDIKHPWAFRYEDDLLYQRYRILPDGQLVLLVINKETGLVAAFKIDDKEFDINSNEEPKGDVLVLYSGYPLSFEEVDSSINAGVLKDAYVPDTVVPPRKYEDVLDDLKQKKLPPQKKMNFYFTPFTYVDNQYHQFMFSDKKKDN